MLYLSTVVFSNVFNNTPLFCLNVLSIYRILPVISTIYHVGLIKDPYHPQYYMGKYDFQIWLRGGEHLRQGGRHDVLPRGLQPPPRREQAQHHQQPPRHRPAPDKDSGFTPSNN